MISSWSVQSEHIKYLPLSYLCEMANFKPMELDRNPWKIWWNSWLSSSLIPTVVAFIPTMEHTISDNTRKIPIVALDCSSRQEGPGGISLFEYSLSAGAHRFPVTMKKASIYVIHTRSLITVTVIRTDRKTSESSYNQRLRDHGTR